MKYIKKNKSFTKNKLLNHCVSICSHESLMVIEDFNNFSNNTCQDITNNKYPGVKDYSKNNKKQKFNYATKRYINLHKTTDNIFIPEKELFYTNPVDNILFQEIKNNSEDFITKKSLCLLDFGKSTITKEIEKEQDIINIFGKSHSWASWMITQFDGQFFFDHNMFESDSPYLDRIKKHYNVEDWMYSWIKKKIGVDYNKNIIDIIDYMKWAEINEWRFKEKCYKINYDTMLIKQRNWINKSQQLVGDKNDFNIFIDCDDMKWGKIITSEGLDYEGAMMKHCVGLGSYDEKKTSIYSLRDNKNIPCVTLEYNEEEKIILQIQGYNNSHPVKYQKYIDYFVKSIGLL